MAAENINIDVIMTNVNSLSKEEAAKWLGNLGLAVSGTKKELTVRIIKYLRYPKLINKLKLKASRNYTFKCSLNPLSIPPNLTLPQNVTGNV